eukprot:CAMPEP_0115615228 /NCGR_PEP_ID=MMETSP0272-20121206/22515_1 /TAXON_ID=71861 /ORGANISM="Scrippsiella trochoidea, Strain CCMP3099" /LENGTH=605 /DNA_ID=CAMNT_0003051135 /DNA_START=93 /DNA_END=1912 /DNA_ORIENTATION=-
MLLLEVSKYCILPCGDVGFDYFQVLPKLYEEEKNRKKFWMQCSILVVSALTGTALFVSSTSLWQKLHHVNIGVKVLMVVGLLFVFPLLPFSVLAVAIIAWFWSEEDWLGQCLEVAPVIMAGEAIECLLSFLLQLDTASSTKSHVYWAIKLRSLDAGSPDESVPIVTGPLQNLGSDKLRACLLIVHYILEVLSGAGCIVLLRFLGRCRYGVDVFGQYYIAQVVMFYVILQEAPLSSVDRFPAALAAPVVVQVPLLDESVHVKQAYAVRFGVQLFILFALILEPSSNGFGGVFGVFGEMDDCRGHEYDTFQIFSTALDAWLLSSVGMWCTLGLVRYIAIMKVPQEWQKAELEKAKDQIIESARQKSIDVSGSQGQKDHAVSQYFCRECRRDQVKSHELLKVCQGAKTWQEEDELHLSSMLWLLAYGWEHLKDLRRVRLSDLHYVPMELCTKLPKLNTMTITCCDALTTLPPELGKSEALEVLIIDGCNIVALPNELGKCRRLKTLKIRNCPKLTALPDKLSQAVALETLVLTKCPELETLPEDLGHATVLKTIRIKDCPAARDFLDRKRPQLQGKLQSGDHTDEEADVTASRPNFWSGCMHVTVADA